MTLKTVIAGNSAVLEDGDMSHLARVRRSVSDSMTLITTHGPMVAMPENSLKVVLRLQRPAIGSQFVADAARPDLALGGVTGITVRVGLEADRDRLAWARWPMTRRASVRWPPFTTRMCRVVKLHIKAFAKPGRKCSLRRRIRLEIIVTDRTHSLVVSGGELVKMAADARFVTRQLYFSRATLSLMTRVTRELLMFRYPMRKSLEFLI